TAAQFRKNALLVDPYDTRGMAAAIRKAYNMSQASAGVRMGRHRKSVQKRDIFWWADRFLRAANEHETPPVKAGQPAVSR
ncbi:MAG: trehalose-6-phosphate synthase, partial [Dehalococcoidia bacterium]